MPHPALPSAVQRLIDEFSRLPGIGPKSASRLTFFLLRQDHADQIGALAQALTELRERTRTCSTCFNITDDDPCRLCSDSHRDSSVLCVVEEPLDVLAIERTGRFRGRYHVLGGAISHFTGLANLFLCWIPLLLLVAWGCRQPRQQVQEVVVALFFLFF